MAIEYPTPKFQRFERVRIIGEEPRCKDYQDEQRIILWFESSDISRKSNQPGQWLYLVCLPARDSWRTFFQSDLGSAGGLDLESAYLGSLPKSVSIS